MVAASPETTLRLLATDPMARIDVPFLVEQMKGRLLSVSEADGVMIFSVETRAAQTG